MPAARRRSMAEFLQQQRELEEPAASGADALGPVPAAVPVVISASSVPDPHSPAGDGRLSPAEKADLATCEAALDNLRLAFAAAGKALQVIRDARLYRSTHDTFEAYVEQRWGMGKSQAYRLVEAWPLAERLSPIGERLTESHVRELLPFAGRHGQDAAAAVYQAVAEADGIRVTASVLHDVVGILPADYFDPGRGGQPDPRLPGRRPRPAAAAARRSRPGVHQRVGQVRQEPAPLRHLGSHQGGPGR